MLTIKGFVGTELRAVPFAGDVAWLEWWTKSSARELLLDSGVPSAHASCAETGAAAGVVRGNPVTTPRASGCRLTTYSLFQEVRGCYRHTVRARTLHPTASVIALALDIGV